MGNEQGASNSPTSRHHNNGGHRHNHSHRHNHGHGHRYNHNRGDYNEYKQQQQVQVKRQDQVIVDTQLLLDDTKLQIQFITDYLKAVMGDNTSKDDITKKNQKVVVGLQCFQMKVDGLREDEIDFADAFKSSAQIIRQFEKEFKSQFGGNKYIMQRLDPCLNYMRAVLQGKDVPDLPYINNYKFDKGTASRVISGITHAQNHVIPDRMKEINNDNERYKKEQRKLKQEYEKNGKKESVQDVNYNELIQDYNTNNIAFALSKKEQDKIIQQQQNEFRYQKPDLMNGTGNESDIGNSDMEVDQQ